MLFLLANVGLTYFKVGTLSGLALTSAKIVPFLPRMVHLLVCDEVCHLASLLMSSTGMVFEHVACDVQVFPSVGLRHPNEHVRVNFGHTPFKYDIDDHVQQRRDTVWASIQSKPLDWRILDPARKGTGAQTSRTDAPRTTMDEEGHNEAARLVLNYLIHHGYAKTAEAFQTQLARAPTRAASPALPIPPPAAAAAPGPDIDSPMLSADHENEGVGTNMLEQRLTIVRAVRRGDIEGALSDLKERFPSVLARDGGIMRLKLRCRQFVELVNAAAEAKRAFSVASSSSHNGVEDVDAMDVDDDAPAQAALKAALAYGRALRTEYKKEATERQDVHALLERTWSVIAYHFPVEAGGEVGRWAGQDARDSLAGEVNQVILGAQSHLLIAHQCLWCPFFRITLFFCRVARIPKATSTRAYLSPNWCEPNPTRLPRCRRRSLCGSAT